MTDTSTSGISFIITIYNKAPFIPGMVRGLASQHLDRPHEFIFVDDGSTDDSLKVLDRALEAYALTARARILRQANTGPSGATNAGVRAARFALCKPVDADDILSPWAATTMAKLMEANGLDLLYGGFTYVDIPDGVSFSPPPDDLGVEIYPDPLWTFCRKGLAGSTPAMWRTDLFLKVGGCDEDVFVQDFSIPLRMAAGGARVGACPDLLVGVGPKCDSGVLGNHPQVIHDLTRTAANHMRHRPDTLPPRHAYWLARRCAGRAWKWARRHDGATLLSGAFWDYVLAMLPVPIDRARLVARTNRVWRDYQLR